MRVTTERLENCQVNMIIELDAADVDEKLRETARQISRKYNVPGYRRGKAPYHAVIRIFGREVIQQQAIDDFGQDLYDEAVKQIEVEPYKAGELKEVEWEPFRMTVLLPIKPEVNLGDYRAVRIPFESKPVSEDDVEQRLKELQRQNMQWVPVERPAALGDQVVLDIEARAGNRPVLSQQGQELLLQAGSKTPLPGFHEEIVTMSPGEEKSFVLTVPEEGYEEEVAGQEATVTVRLHTVREEDIPPLDDDLAMMVGDYATLESLRTAVRESLEEQARQQAESDYLNQVLDAMIEAAVKIEYPPQAVDHEAEMTLDRMERSLSGSGMPLDTFLKMMGKTREAYRQELRPAAEEHLRKRLVLLEIARLEGLQPEPEEVEAEIERLTELMGPEADELRRWFDSPAGRQSVAEDMAVPSAQQRAVQIGKGEAPPKEEVQVEVELEAATKIEAEAETQASGAEKIATQEAAAEVSVEAAGEVESVGSD